MTKALKKATVAHPKILLKQSFLCQEREETKELMLMIIDTDTPRMGKALRALKTWPEISAEHLEQCNDLGIVRSSPFVVCCFLV